MKNINSSKNISLSNKDYLFFLLLSKAFRAMIDKLIFMEENNFTESKMLKDCVWHILYELKARSDIIYSNKEYNKEDILGKDLV